MKTFIQTRPRRAAFALATGGMIATAILLALNPPLSSAGGVPNQTTIRAVGGYKFQPNQSFQDRQRFSPGVSAVQSGGRVTFVNRTREGHSFSLVRRGQLPNTVREFFGCYGPNGVCSSVLEAHRFDDNNDRNDRPEVDVGSTGLDRAGDSVALLPNQRSTQTVSAPAGRNLFLLCVFHPQMQARLGSR
jgi:plastocyanin